MYKFFSVLGRLIELRKGKSDAIADSSLLVAIETIIEEICPEIRGLGSTHQAELRSEIQNNLLDLGGGQKYSIKEVFEMLYQSYDKMSELEQSQSSSFFADMTSAFTKLITGKSQQSLVDQEYDKYKLYQEALKQKFSEIHKTVTEQVVMSQVDKKLLLVNKLVGRLSVEKNNQIKSYISLENKENLEEVLLELVNKRLIFVSKKIEDLLGKSNINYTSHQIVDLNNKYSKIIVSNISQLLFENTQLDQENIIAKLNKLIDSYKRDLLDLKNEFTKKDLEEKSRINLGLFLQNYLASAFYSDFKASVGKKISSIVSKAISKKQADDFSFSLMLTGSKTNSALLTFLHTNCLPFISIIKKILFSIYGPLLKHYETLFEKKDKLIENESYNIIRRLEIGSKLILPGLLMVTSFIFLAPLFNDFLLALIIPACMSTVLKITDYLTRMITSAIEQKKPVSLTNTRLINIFGEDMAVNVAEYYRKKLSKVKDKIITLDKQRHLTLDESKDKELKLLRDELLELNVEWRLLHEYHSSEKDITTEQARAIYFTRIAKSAQKKSSKQQELCAKYACEFEQEDIVLNAGLDAAFDSDLTGEVSDMSSQVKSPVLFAELAAKQAARQYKVDNYCEQIARFKI